MKLITVAAVISFLTITVKSQSRQHEQFPFPPQFQTPSSAVFTSDNSLYLPPENHSPLPYFPMKNVNNLQFPYLPPTGTKAPAVFPTPFPMIISSSMVPNLDEDEEDDDDDFNSGRIRLSSPQPPRQFKNQPNNRTEFHNFNERLQNGPSQQVDIGKKETRNLQKTVSYVRQPIERADSKIQMHMQTPVNQTPASRRMMIAEMGRDQIPIPDQVKTASYQGLQYLPAPPGFVSSTTEPAIPILRLSNEMDLDGSYSYEALGADQTHYVQHSRMENMGSDKEEQVVEGSYSYVGDNGQTFTVHYVADSNGFRASGDHLPVAPPVPEIIQRAIQYNLAEEARRPPGSKPSWEEEANDTGERNHIFAVPPTRSLFTGKTPEAFSYSYSHPPQTSNTNIQNNQNNNLVPAASNQAPVKTVDFTNEQQNKPNNGPISPQITFLASQGAHLPSSNSPQQQSISRMFTNEKLAMPQLMNYEANIKESEPEGSKALWRWQYGANANNDNSNSNKNSISRSFGEGDDIMINFDDMTQEEYTNMMRSQFEPNTNNNQGSQKQPDDSRFVQYTPQEQKQINVNPFDEIQISQESQKTNQPNNVVYAQNLAEQVISPTQDQYTQGSGKYPHTSDLSKQNYNYKDDIVQTSTEQPKISESRKFGAHESHPNIITQKHFVPKSQTVTQSYDYDDPSFYDVRKIKSFKPESSNIMTMKHKINHDVLQSKPETILSTVSNINEHYRATNTDNNAQNNLVPTPQPAILTTIQSNHLKFTDFIVKDERDNFRPLIPSTTPKEEKQTSTTTTTENSIEHMFENNIFLKNLVRSNKNNIIKHNDIIEQNKQQKQPVYNNFNTISAESKQQVVNNYNANNEEIKHQKQPVEKNPHAEPKADKSPKFIFANPSNEIKIVRKKPLDMSDVLNYVAHKNHFESSKIKPQSKPIFSENFNQQKRELYYTNVKEQEDNKYDYEKQQGYDRELRTLNQQQHEELKGNVNNYKTDHEEHQNNNARKPLNLQQQEELRGIIKNYKVLNRNNNVHHEQNSQRKENPVPYRMLQMQSSNLPPLGRAGPTVKTYLPPIYI